MWSRALVFANESGLGLTRRRPGCRYNRLLGIGPLGAAPTDVTCTKESRTLSFLIRKIPPFLPSTLCMKQRCASRKNSNSAVAGFFNVCCVNDHSAPTSDLYLSFFGFSGTSKTGGSRGGLVMETLVEYTETVERLCKQLDRDKSTKVVLCIRGGPLVVPVCTAAALQRYELALSSRARAVPSSSILEAVASGRPNPPGSRASRSAFGRRTTSASWMRARGSRRGARRRGEGVCDERPKRQPKRRVGASPFWPIVARRQSSSPSPEIAGAAERLGASVYPSVDSSARARALSPCPGL